MEQLPIRLVRGCDLKDFWKHLPENAEETLLALEYDGRKGEVTTWVPGVGSVVTYLDACSEGADRGGYVKYARLLSVTCEGEPVVLEAETDGSEFLFEPRSTRL